ncbi:MAG: thiamine-phosphate kinase [Epsilonproteobacteria bacterium]|nr:thiamine-phosphate kinase [Campylobacterota bacterium]
MDRESYFIDQFKSKLLGDDGAVVGKWIYSKDLFCEGVHFKREWFSIQEIAQKAMLVNISDAIAMNAIPKFALVGISIPKEFTKKELKEIAQGLQEEGVEIVGGDTVVSNTLSFSITLVSYSKKPLFRKPLREGYLLGYTGELGKSLRELKRAFRSGKVKKRGKFRKPKLRKEFIRRCGRVLKVGMDISDGLFDDLAKLSKLNKKGVEFFFPIPKEVGCSGEEYEIVFAISSKDREAVIRRAKISRTKITFFGKVVRGRFRNLCKPHHL